MCLSCLLIVSGYQNKPRNHRSHASCSWQWGDGGAGQSGWHPKTSTSLSQGGPPAPVPVMSGERPASSWPAGPSPLVPEGEGKCGGSNTNALSALSHRRINKKRQIRFEGQMRRLVTNVRLNVLLAPHHLPVWWMDVSVPLGIALYLLLQQGN